MSIDFPSYMSIDFKMHAKLHDANRMSNYMPFEFQATLMIIYQIANAIKCFKLQIKITNNPNFKIYNIIIFQLYLISFPNS